MDLSYYLPRLDAGHRRALEERLLGILQPRRVARLDEVIARRTRRVAIICEDLYHPHNAAAVLRSAECFGIQDVDVVEAGNRFRPDLRAAAGADRWLTIRRWPDLGSGLASVRARGMRVAATSVDPSSISLDEVALDRPLALMLGTEETGLSEAALAAADLHVHVPMVGFTRSLNVSVTAALCLRQLTARLRRERDDWSLPAAEAAELRLAWLMQEGPKARALTMQSLREWGLVAAGPTPAGEA
jgi:tRNA (guanosine-2'-O-)-methyltransferase